MTPGASRQIQVQNMVSVSTIGPCPAEDAALKDQIGLAEEVDSTEDVRSTFKDTLPSPVELQFPCEERC